RLFHAVAQLRDRLHLQRKCPDQSHHSAANEPENLGRSRGRNRDLELYTLMSTSSLSGYRRLDLIERAAPVRRTVLALAAATTLVIAGTPAMAQVVLFVNGDPVTNLDIEQRGKLVQLTLRRTAPRQELIDDIINDKLKIQVGKRFRIDVTDSDV